MRFRIKTISAVVALVLVAKSSQALSQPDGIFEAQLFAGNTFQGSGRCNQGANLSYTDNNVRMIRNHLQYYGYSSLTIQYDDDVGPEDFVDFSRVNAQGRDNWWPWGADMGDIAVYSGHGSYSCAAGNYKSGIVMVNPWMNPNVPQGNNWSVDYSQWISGACIVDTKDHMIMGNQSGDLDVLILDACNTTQKCVWQGGGYNAMAASQMSTLLGFHGFSWDMANQHRYDDFGAFSAYENIGGNWVDSLTDLKLFSHDQCATAVIFGDSPASRDSMYNHGGFLDLKQTGVHSGSTFYYWCNCDPESGEALGC